MFLKSTNKPWFTQDVDEAMFTTLTQGLDPWFMGSVPAGLNKYFWPGRPAADLTVLSSCSGVPMTHWAYEACLEAFSRLVEGMTPRTAGKWILQLREEIVQGIRDAIHVPSHTQVILTQSPAEAYRLAALLLWFEAGCKPMTAILPMSSEAISALPAAVRGCFVAGELRHGEAAISEPVDVVQIALRQSDGRLRPDVQILDEFHMEAGRAAHEAVIYGTLGDGTGTVAPLFAAPRARLVLDAAQMRLRPERVGDHVKRGWPVVMSGSGFLGAPGATGALVLPLKRFRDDAIVRAIAAGGFDFRDGWDPQKGPLPYSGCVLRWLPAVGHLRGMSALGNKAQIRIAKLTFEMTNFLEEFPSIAVLDGRTEYHVSVCGRDSGIVTFAIRDPAKPQRWLTMPDLIALYHDLAAAGVLLGHPVAAGGRAALRIAVSAEDVHRGDIDASLARLADALTRPTGLRPLVRRKRGPEPAGGPSPGLVGGRSVTSRRTGTHLCC